MNQYSSSFHFLFLFLVVTSSFTPISAQTLSYKQFTEEDSLPSLTTYEIEQDSRGIL
ncbi:MAG: hypothetical protein ACI86M_002915 [Saprospiraceae bacterium]|jgi:hypothetical protein